ncbi:hypothetical protein JOM56_010861 [Amanita muscaria]
MSIITETYGALLLGILAATFLSGMNTLQTVLYFRLFPEDPIALKALVSVVWSLDIIHTSFIWVSLWTYFIVNIGQIPKIDEIQTPELIPGTIVVTAVVTFTVHMFYLQRIFRLSNRNYWISAPILLLSLTRVGGSVPTSVDMYRAKRFSVFVASGSEWILSLGLSSAAATDVAIMVAMFILLKSSRDRSISLNNVIDQLILYTLEMGSVTAIMAVVCMITWFTLPHTLIFGAVYLCLSKLYAISLTGMLITRYQLRQRNESENSQAWKMSKFVRAGETSQSTTSTPIKSTEVPLQEVHVDMTEGAQYDHKTRLRF